MTVSEVDERLQSLEGYAKTLAQSTRVMDERRYILEPLISDGTIKAELHKKLDQSIGANAFNHLVPLLGHDLLRDLARLVLDRGKKAGSLRNLFRKASEENTRAALREQFRQIPDKWHESAGAIPGLTEEESEAVKQRWKDKDRNDFAESFDKGYEKVRTAIEELESDRVAEAIRTFRDKYHAHLEVSSLGEETGPFPVGELGLKYRDLLEFMDKYLPAIFELVRILTGNVYDIEEFSDIHRRQGSEMWRVLAGISTTDETRTC